MKNKLLIAPHGISWCGRYVKFFFYYIDYYDRNKKNKNKPEYSVPSVPKTNNVIISIT